MYSELDIVVLNRDVTEHRLKRGDLGTVVGVLGPEGIEVEFVTAAGNTEALLTLDVDDVRPVGDTDLVTVRSRTA